MSAPNYPLAPNVKSEKPLNLGNLTFPSDLESYPFYITLRAEPFNTSSKSFSDIITRLFSGGIPILPRTLTDPLAQIVIDTITRNTESLRKNVSSSVNDTTVRLPIPLAVNDVQTLTWSQESLKAIASRITSGLTGIDFIGLGDVAGAPLGYTVNPFLFMMFHSPNFKTYQMTWQLVAENEAESQTIAKIIDFIKYESSPERNSTTGSILLSYPSIFKIKFHPNDKFTIKTKPMIIEALAADYTSGGYPSFHENGAPSAISLTIKFKELDVWLKDNWTDYV
jgi:hypothetical protein